MAGLDITILSIVTWNITILVSYFQKCLSPGLSARFLFRHIPAFCKFSYILMINNKRNIPRITNFPHITLVCVSTISAKAMMYMHRRNFQCSISAFLSFIPKLCKHKKQAYGICTSRYAYNYSVLFLQHMLFFYISFYFLIHLLYPVRTTL